MTIKCGRDKVCVICYEIQFMSSWLGIADLATLFYHKETNTLIVAMHERKIEHGTIVKKQIDDIPDNFNLLELFFFEVSGLDEQGFPILPKEFFRFIGSADSNSIKEKKTQNDTKKAFGSCKN